VLQNHPSHCKPHIHGERTISKQYRTALIDRISSIYVLHCCEIFACVLIGVGSYALNNTSNALAGQTLPSGLIVMGVFMLVLAAIGAISAWKESVVGLGFYLAFLLIITIILFSIGVAIAVQKDQAGLYIEKAWYNAPLDVKASIQLELLCCGLMTYNISAGRWRRRLQLQGC
jgi:hypothetical protein